MADVPQLAGCQAILNNVQQPPSWRPMANPRCTELRIAELDGSIGAQHRNPAGEELRIDFLINATRSGRQALLKLAPDLDLPALWRLARR